ncbi:MAG TPA: FtsX-like permease family protein, partial [Ktedonobacterales bacterium]|nr:FtsX-like permease family protein [Ktedonobacterales bacterium]
RPLASKDAYWGPEQTVPVAAFTDVATYFSVLNGEGTVDSDPQLVSVATATLSPDKATIRKLGAQASLDGLRRLHGQLGERRADEVVISDLEAALNSYVDQVAVAAFAVQLVAIQLLLVALYCVWFLAGNLLAQQRQAIAIWRSRGWSWRGVSILLFIELGVAALVAAPIGIAAGWLASEWAARFQYRGQLVPPFHFDLVRLGAPIAVVLVVELLLLAAQSVLASRHGVLRARAAASRPPVAWWQRRYVDVVLALLALPLLGQLRVLGSATVRATGAGDNPVYLVLPGIALAFIAIAAVRLLPLAALGLARLRRSVAARLAFMQLQRAHGQHAGLATLLMLAVAVGVFASTYAATAARNAGDRAAYFTGSDVRATFGGSVTVLPDAIPIKGAAARSAVFRGDARVGDVDVPIIAVDPYTFKPAMYTRDDLASSPLPGLVQQLVTKETGGLLLAPTAKTLSIWVHGSATGGSLTAHLSDADGRPVHADLGSLDFSGWKQFSAPLVGDGGTIRPPVRFRDLAISRVTTAGDIAVSALAVDGTVIETFAQVIEGPGASQFPGFWWRTDWDMGSIAEYLPPSNSVPRNGARTAHFRVVPAAIPTYLRPGQVEQVLPGFATALTGVIPALVPAQMLSHLGLSIGQTAQIVVGNVAMTALLMGVADHFPTMYPEQGDFMILDRDPLLIGLSVGRHQRPFPNEIWVRADSGSADAALASLKSAPGVIQVYDRR